MINENVFGNIKVFLKHKLIRILIELTFGDVRISGESLFCKEFDKLIPHFCMAYISDVYFPGPVPDNSIRQSETGAADIWPIRGSYPARISIYWWLSNDGFLLRSCSLSSDSVITSDFIWIRLRTQELINGNIKTAGYKLYSGPRSRDQILAPLYFSRLILNSWEMRGCGMMRSSEYSRCSIFSPNQRISAAFKEAEDGCQYPRLAQLPRPSSLTPSWSSSWSACHPLKSSWIASASHLTISAAEYLSQSGYGRHLSEIHLKIKCYLCFGLFLQIMYGRLKRQ